MRVLSKLGKLIVKGGKLLTTGGDITSKLELQEVKPNGNIVLTDGTNSKEYMAATPSGDPMHYAYVAAGAEYNATGADIVKTAPWGDQVTHKAGYWYYQGIGDLTDKQIHESWVCLPLMRTIGANNIFSFAYLENRVAMCFNQGGSYYKQRVSFGSFDSSFANSGIELIDLRGKLTNDISTTAIYSASTFNYMFYSCGSLKYILGALKPYSSGAGFTNTFSGCVKLEIVYIRSALTDISFSSCKNLRMECIVFVVSNAVNTAAITITLHADAYARCVADTTEYTYQGQTYTGVIAYAAARQISIVSA